MEKACIYAKENNYDTFTTTLFVSPYQKHELIKKICEDLSKKYDIPYLFSDFKKKGGYARSVELSGKYDLYRQDFCGCVYSKRRDFVGIQNT